MKDYSLNIDFSTILHIIQSVIQNNYRLLRRRTFGNVYRITLSVREVNNRLIGFAHPVNYFTHPVNSTCPLPKIAHPVNYLAHRKMGTTIIKNSQFRQKFSCKIDQLQRGNHSQTTPGWQYLSAILKLVNI